MGPRLRQVDGTACGGPPGLVPGTVNSPPLCLSEAPPGNRSRLFCDYAADLWSRYAWCGVRIPILVCVLRRLYHVSIQLNR